MNRLMRELGVTSVVATLLAQRGFNEPSSAERHLHPKLAHLDDPFAIKNMDRAVERLIAALRDGERITVVGDYDVDGVTSTSLLVMILRRFGASPRYFVPRRLDEGYGLSEAALERALVDGKPDLFIALDCGTNSVAEVASLTSLGIDVLIIDHHQSKDETPADAILINPHISGQSDEAWGDSCTVGLVFKFVHGLVKRMRELGDPVAKDIKLRDYLDLVALGTVADLVPLRDENRIFTRFGLQRLGQTERPGLLALMQVAGLELEQPLATTDIAFRLGPRINASGRLADAAVPVNLLLSEEYGESLEIARELDSRNRERQTIERAIVEEARKQALEQGDAAGLVVHGANWHPGVVGIVAGKLAKEFYRPCMALGGEGDLAKGSGRSVAGIDLQAALHFCDHLLMEWGGHPMAVGVTLEASHVPELRKAFAHAVSSVVPELLEPDLAIAAWLDANQLHGDVVASLEELQPYGQAHPTPVIGLRGVRLTESPMIFAESHARFRFKSDGGDAFSAVAWNFAKRLPPTGRDIELAVKLGWNRWQGRCEPQAEVLDWR
ncbi:single-stranded-DNA-specific exonuclease RecJ [Cerasicoccus arenae]|uniref:Single-stranded-DNA-specific exonuclease RecJ n=2 Tax=Cerasicoccus arenae TaxID=424488 RepID=A0A8J3GFN8_9BACT|nr:single-stranded-DNA-specific exonuclease RecJ [Cerasicoccus arenae]GHC07429.1 single-stranded-DNA-specific exonuclease RecJ [Cerasicoccus arenae]